MGHALHVLVADDENLIRDLFIEAVGESRLPLRLSTTDNGRDCLTLLNGGNVDIAFIDIHMPELDGLEVVRTVGVERMPVVVFVTAHEQYAVRAFDVRAADYVLKPVADDQFAQVLARAKQQVHARAKAG